MDVREMRVGEHAAWIRMRQALWPDLPAAALAAEAEEILSSAGTSAVFVALAADGEPIGFAEVSLRDWAEGCESRPVGYLEAWYVASNHRGAGVGRRLVEAAERWSLMQGCTEMGSDAELPNEVSHQAHRALGFQEVFRLVLYRKRLGVAGNQTTPPISTPTQVGEGGDRPRA